VGFFWFFARQLQKNVRLHPNASDGLFHHTNEKVIAKRSNKTSAVSRKRGKEKKKKKRREKERVKRPSQHRRPV
jgi:hypothetical protein